MMTIKKNRAAAAPASASAGGAVIADRLRLDSTAPVASAGAGKATTCAVVFALVAVAVSGLLTFTLWQHWDFLMAY